MKNRVMVVVSGEKINLEFTLTVPARDNLTQGRCFDPDGKPIYTFTVHPALQKVVHRTTSIAFEKSGQYNCQFKESKVYFVVLVKGEFEESNVEVRLW